MLHLINVWLYMILDSVNLYDYGFLLKLKKFALRSQGLLSRGTLQYLIHKANPIPINPCTTVDNLDLADCFATVLFIGAFVYYYTSCLSDDKTCTR